MKYLLIVIYSIMSNGALLVMKYGSNKGMLLSLSKGFLNMQLSYYSIGGFLMYIASFLIYVYLISKYNLSYIIPVTSALSYIFIFISSVFFLKESLSLYQTIGFFVIMTGVILMNIK